MRKLILSLSLGVVGLYLYFEWDKKRKNGPKPEPEPPTVNPVAAVTITEPDWKSPFDQSYMLDVAEYVAPRKIVLPQKQRLQDWVQRIWDAKANTWFGDDDEEEVEQVFSEMHDAVEVAALSAEFYNTKRRDLWKYLSSFLTSEELKLYVEMPVLRLAPYQLTSILP